MRFRFFKPFAVAASLGSCMTPLPVRADNEDYYQRVRNHANDHFDALAIASMIGILVEVTQTPASHLIDYVGEGAIGVDAPGAVDTLKNVQNVRARFNEYWDDIERTRSHYRNHSLSLGDDSFPPMVLSTGPFFLPGPNGKPREVSKQEYLDYVHRR